MTQKHSHKHAHTKSEQSKFSFKDFDQKKLNVLLILVFLTITLLVGFHIRTGPSHLDGLEDNIERSILNQINQIIQQDIRAQNPFMQDAQVQRQANARVAELAKDRVFTFQGQTVDLDAEIQSQLQRTKANFQTDDGQTYLIAMDPHYFFKLSANYYFNGHIGEYRVAEGNAIMTKRMAPSERIVTDDAEFIFWFTAQLYKLNGVTEDTTYGEKLQIVFFVSVFFALLASFPMYFLVRRFTNDLSAFFATLIFTSFAIFATRTVAGFFDTDAFTVLFPLLVSVFFIYALTTKRMWLAITNASIAGFFIGVGMWAWRDNWFIALLLILSAIGYFVYLLIADFLETKKVKFGLKDKIVALTTATFAVSAVIFTYIFGQGFLFQTVWRSATGQLTQIAGFGASIWPNVLSSVAELNPASFAQIVNTAGGKTLFILALTGLLFLTTRYKNNAIKYSILTAGVVWFALITNGVFTNLAVNQSFLFLALLTAPISVAIIIGLITEQITDKEIFLAAFLTAWLAGTMYMSFNGVRFIQLMSPAFAIAAGVAFFYLGKELNNLLENVFDVVNKTARVIPTVIILTIVFLTLWVPIVEASNQANRQNLPAFDDAWHEAMYNIRDNSQETAIITSWWDFGHFFHAVADRGVTFDGASQTLPQSHWVGKLLLEQDDEVAQDILQMLVCGGNQAFDTMQSYANDSTGGVLINRIIYQTLGTQNNAEILQNNQYFNFTEEQTDNILNYLACENPRENFLIVSEDMVGKAPVWGHWGLWDFDKKYVHDNYRRLSAEQIASNLKIETATVTNYVNQLTEIDRRARLGQVRRNDAINQWFSPYPQYITRGFQPCRAVDQDNIVCFEGININLETRTVQQNPQLPVGRLILATPDGLDITDLNRPGVDFVISSINGQPHVLAGEYPHGTSLFTKLFFLEGADTQYFEKFTDVRSMTTGRVIVYKTVWD